MVDIEAQRDVDGTEWTDRPRKWPNTTDRLGIWPPTGSTLIHAVGRTSHQIQTRLWMVLRMMDRPIVTASAFAADSGGTWSSVHGNQTCTRTVFRALSSLYSYHSSICHNTIIMI